MSHAGPVQGACPGDVLHRFLGEGEVDITMHMRVHTHQEAQFCSQIHPGLCCMQGVKLLAV